MDSFTLTKLEFDQVRRILGRYCRCALGRNLLPKIEPSRRPETVRRWLTETTQMVAALRDFGPPPFAGVTDIAEALARVEPGGGAAGEDFAAIVAAMDGSNAVARWTNGLPEDLEFIRQMGGRLPNFTADIEMIRRVVDSRGEVLDSASPALGRTRREIETTRQKIHDVIHNYARRPEVKKILQNPTVTLHDDRFVLPVKADRRGELPGVVHRASHTGATLFVEPNESVELNNRLVGLCDDERREVVRLLNELAIQVSKRRQDISSAMKTLGQLDILSAKGHYAYEFEFSCPEINERGGLQLHQARHPLLVEQVHQRRRAAERGEPVADLPGGAFAPPTEVVPIDVRLGTDFDVLIITGSNTGGKTVTLKTVGLLAIMAQSGLHIPVQRGSSLPVYRDIFIDVGDEQSLEQSLSTFGAHIKRIKTILRRADRYGLVLLDELGSGTDPDEGGAIGQAVLDDLRRTGCMALVSTHLSVLKAYAFTHDRVDNASVEFNTRTLRPTFRLRIGEAGESHAITVSAAIGLPKHIVSAARKHLGERAGAFNRAIRSTTHARRASEEARTQAHTARLEAENVQESYQSKLSELHQLQRHFENWLASLSEFKPGDEVPVPQAGRTGKLVRLQFNKQVALVDVDNLQVEVPLRDLIPDLGQAGVRQEIASLREQILAQARQAEAIRADAARLQTEYHRSLAHARSRKEQYDRWLAAIGSARVGQQVTISREPGKAKLIELDFLAAKAKVATDSGEIVLPMQELFPQTGPFAPKDRRPRRKDRKPGDRDHAKGRGKGPAQGQAKPKSHKDQPVVRRSPDSRSAKDDRDAVLKIEPGEELYVVPFHKRGRLIRFNHERDEALVSIGAFEMQIPISDLAPPRGQP